MDTDWFQEALRLTDQTQADLARHLSLAPSAVSRMLRGERRMTLHEAVQTAEFLGISQEEIVRRAGDPAKNETPPEPARRGRPPVKDHVRPFPLLWGERIPIRQARQGEKSQTDEPVGFAPRPANLAGVLGAYAIYMDGDTLSPRYEPGWLLQVHPHKPPTSGRDVVIVKKDGSVLVKQFVGWNDDALELRQLHPARTEEISRDEIVACHLIVGVDQEG